VVDPAVDSGGDKQATAIQIPWRAAGVAGAGSVSDRATCIGDGA